MQTSFEDSLFTNGDKVVPDLNGHDNGSTHSEESHTNGILTPFENGNGDVPMEKLKKENEDYVSGTLYDILQKEVITLRKACNEKDQSLKDKDDAIEV